MGTRFAEIRREESEENEEKQRAAKNPLCPRCRGVRAGNKAAYAGKVAPDRAADFCPVGDFLTSPGDLLEEILKEEGILDDMAGARCNRCMSGKLLKQRGPLTFRSESTRGRARVSIFEGRGFFLTRSKTPFQTQEATMMCILAGLNAAQTRAPLGTCERAFRDLRA